MIQFERITGCALVAIVAIAAALTMPPLHAAVVDYQRTVVVSPIGPTETDNGAELLTALSSISTAIPAPSATNPWLLKVEPGVYDVGSAPVLLPSHVDMEGSGQGVTLVRGSVIDALPAQHGVITVAGHSEVRQLSVENTVDGATFDSAALLLLGGARASEVTAIATGSSVINRALAVVDLGIAPVASVSDVTATAATRAVQVFAPGLDAENLVAEGTEGLFVSSGEVLVRNSRFSGSDVGLSVANLSPTVDLVSTQVLGSISCTSGNCRCFASYDEELRGLKKDCDAKK